MSAYLAMICVAGGLACSCIEPNHRVDGFFLCLSLLNSEAAHRFVSPLDCFFLFVFLHISKNTANPNRPLR